MFKLLLVFFLFNSFIASADAPFHLIKDPDDREDTPFLSISEDFLVPGNTFWGNGKIHNLKKKLDNDWLTIETSELKNEKFSEGQTIEYLDFKTGKVNSYTFKEKVHIAYIPSDFYTEGSGDDYYRSYYILLKDTISETKHPGKSNSDYVTGLTYIGSEYKLKDGMVAEPKYIAIKESNPDITEIVKGYNSSRKNQNPFILKDSEVYTTEGLELYRLRGTLDVTWTKENQGIGLVLKTGNAFYALEDYWGVSDYASMGGESRVGKFIEGVDLVIIKNLRGMHECYQLFVIKNNTVKSFALRCDSGGC